MALKPRRNGCREPQATEASDGEESAAGTGGYQLYVQRGGEHGLDLDDWLQAKREFESRALCPEQAN
jgi:hypothetical protein